MAYAVAGNTAAAALSAKYDGRKCWRWYISETEARDTSTFTLYGAPSVGTITLLRSALTAGTGTTVRPEVGRGTGWTDGTIDEISRAASAAALAEITTNVRYTRDNADELVIRTSANNATADHTVVTEIVIFEGHL